MYDNPTPPRKTVPWAVALKYDGEGAPIVTATGGGEVARKIIEVAEAHQIPLRQDPELTALLAQIPLGEEIPAPLYRAVAEVLAFVYRLKQQLDPERSGAGAPLLPPK